MHIYINQVTVFLSMKTSRFFFQLCLFFPIFFLNISKQELSYITLIEQIDKKKTIKRLQRVFCLFTRHSFFLRPFTKRETGHSSLGCSFFFSLLINTTDALPISLKLFLSSSARGRSAPRRSRWSRPSQDRSGWCSAAGACPPPSPSRVSSTPLA